MKVFSFGIIFILFISSGAWAEEDGSKQRKVLRTSQMILDEIQKSPDQQIPMNLISKAKAIIVFPTMLKAGFFVGARYGKGIASVRTAETGEWGPPAFLYTTGGSFGFQFGAQAVDLILLVMSQRGLEGLLSEQFTLGGDIALSAGPVGRHAEASADVFMQGEIYSYSRSKGIFGGISLKGTIITTDLDANLAYYGHPYTAEEILLTKQVRKIPESGKQFIRIFNQLAPPLGVKPKGQNP
ncbi:MAG: lipid-binding SYLF domain-containing protein [Nitrospina sp.]|jgi:lipid-binding SYLF domain-containing protein|nr:lipid-binding SYLF domain-containing protein [Nitrospina sp.]MBT6716401.1 lipid-binding SYLF domain-containing protein [Nitrospina sp.]